MPTGPMMNVLDHLRAAVHPSDAQLLHAYRTGGDRAALAILVRRHAPMVWGVCRRVLHDRHAAEDAFQAAFLVLVRRATAIAAPESFANWLYGVAYRRARNARASAARRRARETQVADFPDPPARPTPADDFGPVLDRELSRLPDKYRTAIVLCGLEGKTRAAAAKELGVPDGTLAAWVARGREMLAARLARRGLTVPAAALTAGLAQGAAPPALVAATLRTISTAGPATPAVALADEVARGLALAKTTKWASTAVVVLGLSGLAIGLGTWPGPDGRPAPRPEARSAAAVARAATDRDRLQGTWAVVGSEMDGVKDFDRPRGHERLVVTGDRVTYWAPKGPLDGRFRVDPTRAPAEIDIEFDDGAILRGLYEFDGPRLRFCWTKGGRRPAGFDTSTGELLTFLYTYEKRP
jgi:RNA polymerase sigma factor (sigma-70 family)